MKTYSLKVKNNDIFATMNAFFQQLLSEKVVDMLLLPQESVKQASVMQTLVKSREQISRPNPFAPLLLMNSATLVSQLTVDNPEAKLGVVLRSCEIRALIELVKLKQINVDRLVIIGMDCAGTYESYVYQELMKKYKDSYGLTKGYLSQSADGVAKAMEGHQPRLACQGCEYPGPENCDIAVNFIGCDLGKEICIQLKEGLEALKPESFGLTPSQDNSRCSGAVEACRKKRMKRRDEIFKQVLETASDIRNFLKELEHCRRCYNCRKECPICYCRECIFDSLTFEHASEQYLEWARKRGKIRMPADTLLFHITRMNHMVISCVGCGQCSSSCPNRIPIAKFFKTIGYKVQDVFEYRSGRSIEEEIPQSTFKEDEFPQMGKGSHSEA